MLFVRILFHLSPLIPLALSYYYLGVATILLVALAYIKVAKLLTEWDNSQKNDQELWKAICRWHALTFLPPLERDGGA